MTGHERGDPVDLDVVKARPLLTSDFNQIAESRSRKQTRGRASPLDDRVCRDGRPMRQALDVGDAQREPSEDPLDAVDDRSRRIRWDGGDLLDVDPSIGVDEPDVRERPAYVDAAAAGCSNC